MNCECSKDTHIGVHPMHQCAAEATIRVRWTPTDEPTDVCGRCFGHGKKFVDPANMEVLLSGAAYRAAMEKEAEK